MNSTQKNRRYQTGTLFAFSFLTASTYVFMRALAVSIFLARLGPDGLPLAFFASAIVVIFVSELTRIAIRKLRTGRAAVVTWLLMAAITVAIGFVLGPYHHSLIALCVLYVFAEIRGSLNTVYVVTLSNEAFAGRSSKRPYAIVASGAPVAGILIGFVLGVEASLVLVMPAFIATAVLDVLTAFTAAMIPAERQTEDADPTAESRYSIIRQSDKEKSDEDLIQFQYRRLLVLLVALQIIVLTLVGYQWKVSIGNYYGIDETKMIAYFAIFYAVSDMLIVLLQWSIVGHLMDRLGIGIGLIGFPLAIGLVAVIALFMDSPMALLVVFTLGKGLNVQRRALHDPSLTVAYSVVDPDIRPETIVFVKGMVKPFAEAVSAFLLLFIGGVILEYWITWIWLVATIPWLYFAIQVSKLYRIQRNRISKPELASAD